MPWKLIFFVLLLAFVLTFIGFNLENSCNVSFGVYTFEKVPIFMSILGAFALGVFVMLPFCFGRSRSKKRNDGAPSQPQNKKSAVSQTPQTTTAQSQNSGSQTTSAPPVQYD